MTNILLSAHDFTGEIENYLIPFVGEGVAATASHSLLNAALDVICYGKDPTKPNDILSDFRIPSIFADTFADALKDKIETCIPAFSLEEFNKDKLGYYWVSSDTLVITLTPPKPQPKENLFLESIKEGLANGDWYPEQIRRLVEG